MVNLNDFDWGSSSNWFKKTIQEEIFEKKTYEKFFQVEEGDLVVDVGASIGPFTFSILNNKPKRVYCLEPSLEEFPTLRKNTKGYKVSCINKGISEVNGLVKFNDVYGIKNSSTVAESITFKDFIDEYNLTKIDFLKVDCEGGEYSIFNKSNIWWIKNNVKKISGEFHLHVGDYNLVPQFTEFRDLYLKLFPNFEVFSIDGANIKWDLWNQHFLDYYRQVIIYIDNRF